MKVRIVGFLALAAALSAVPLAAQSELVNGTWSGSWTPAGGVRDAVTVEMRQDDNGKLTGKFLTPSQMPFTKAMFDGKTKKLLLEATDEKSGKLYKIDGKIAGTEITGTLDAAGQKGQLLLIKWTYVPRIAGY